jgi:hypothetical protein
MHGIHPHCVCTLFQFALQHLHWDPLPSISQGHPDIWQSSTSCRSPACTNRSITQLQFSNVPETLWPGPMDSTLHEPLCTRPAWLQTDRCQIILTDPAANLHNRWIDNVLVLLCLTHEHSSSIALQYNVPWLGILLSSLASSMPPHLAYMSIELSWRKPIPFSGLWSHNCERS